MIRAASTFISGHSFKHRLVATVFFIQFLTLSIFGVIAILEIQHRANEALHQNLQTAANIYSERAAFALITSNENQRREIISFASDSPNIDTIFLLDRHGDLIESAGEPLAISSEALMKSARPDLEIDDVNFDARWLFVVPVFSSEEVIGDLDLAGSEQGSGADLLGYYGFIGNNDVVTNYIVTIYFALGLLILTAVLAVFFLSRVMAKILLRPLERMIDETRLIARNNYRGAVSEKGPAEFQALGRATNELLQRVVKDSDEMQRLVADRTEDEQEQRKIAEGLLAWRAQIMSVHTHELLTPLSIMLTAMDDLRQDASFVESADTRDAIEESLDGLMTQISRIESIVNSVNLSWHIEQRSVKPTIGLVSPKLIISGLREVFTLKADQSKNTIEFQGEAEREFQSDALMIEKICSNLVDNACKYTNGGTIVFSMKVQDNDLQVTCDDTGIGIAADKLDFIFEPLQQGDMSTRRIAQGMGLGLSIVKGFVETLGGTIAVESELGAGSRFKIVVPISEHAQSNLMAE